MFKKYIFPYKDCYVYIVEGKNGNFYTGITWNVRKRIRQHNGLKWGGAKFTDHERPIFLVHIERFNSRKEAVHRELEIKSFSHNQKKELIQKTTKEQVLAAI
jgi:putative endonuclease